MSRKEFTQVRRDPYSLIVVLFLPLIQILLLGYGARLDANHIPVYVLDQEGSQDSQALLKAFQASPYFDVVKAANRDAVCAVRSRGEQGQEVGFAMVPVPRRPDGQRTTTVDYLLATTATAYTGEVTNCRLGPR